MGETFKKQVEHYRARDANEFWDMLRPRLERDRPGDFIYRGVGDAAKHRLIPSALRKKDELSLALFGPITSENSRYADLIALEKFVAACDRSGLPLPGDGALLRASFGASYWLDRGWPPQWPPEEHRQVWAVAQHHGLPTRLLDWTRNPYTAAYFAAVSCLRSSPPRTQQLAVWMLDRRGEYCAWGSRIAIVEIPAAHSPNLAAQAGLFSMPLFSTEIAPQDPFPAVPALDDVIAESVAAPLDPQLEQLYRPGRQTINVLLSKYTLDAEHARDLLDLCRHCGVSGATMFPGYDGAVKEVQERSLVAPGDVERFLRGD